MDNKEQDDEDIHISIPLGIILITFFGLLMGFTLGILYSDYEEENKIYRSPDEIADLLLGMLFNNTILEELNHPQLQALMKMDTTTLADLKRWYTQYNMEGNRLSRSMLEGAVDNICFKKRWNWTN